MLAIKNIYKKFKNNQVLSDINIEFEKNKVTGLLGNNGVGKTTLLKIIFQELEPNGGEILFDNRLIKSLDFLNLHFFTENNELPKTLTVEEYCDYYLNLKYQTRPTKEKLKSLEWIFDYTKFRKNKIEKLSAGEKKMYSLFILFLIDAKIFFFDEPTANLDAENKNIIITAIKYLKQEKKTIVIITHLIEEVSELLDNIIIFKGGKVVYEEKITENKNIKKIYADVVGQMSEKEIMSKLTDEKV